MNNTAMQESTSTQAYNAIKPALPSLRTRVLDAVKAAGPDGLINDDLYRANPGTPTSSLNARLSELQKTGFVKVHGVRKNSRGRNMQVWIAA